MTRFLKKGKILTKSEYIRRWFRIYLVILAIVIPIQLVGLNVMRYLGWI